MNMQEYYTLFPNQKVWRDSAWHGPDHGMLEFDESAGYLAGPFNEKYAYYYIHDARTSLHYSLQTYEDLKKDMFCRGYNFPRRLQLGLRGKLSEHRANSLVQELTPKEFRQMNERIEDSMKAYHTIERPVGFHICGDDDATYTKFFATLEEANNELRLLELCQPLNMKKDLINDGFVFTN